MPRSRQGPSWKGGDAAFACLMCAAVFLSFISASDLAYPPVQAISVGGSAGIGPSASTATVSITMGFSVVGGGQGFSPPVLSYFLSGGLKTATLNTTLVQYNVDDGSVWNVTRALAGGTATEAWQTKNQTSGKAAFGSKIKLVYYHQYSVKFGYSIVGSSTGFHAPKASYKSYGSTASVSTVSTVWVDNGTPYVYPTTIQGTSSGERFQTLMPSGIVLNQNSVIPRYYHQYMVTFSYAVHGGGLPPAPSLTAMSAGSNVISNFSSAPLQLWVDQGSKYSATGLLSSSNPGERWLGGSTSSGFVTSSTSLRIDYYNQYLVTADYSVRGEKSLTVIFLTGRFANSTTVYSLTTLPQTFWLDGTSTFSLPSVLTASSNERWIASGQTTGIVTSPSSVSVTYYHQYLILTSYSVIDGGTASAPTLAYSSLGGQESVVLQTSQLSFWADNGTGYNVATILPGSGAVERWASVNYSGTVGAPVSFQARYYHQFEVQFSYRWVGQAANRAPIVQFTGYGSPGSQALSGSGATMWMDSGSVWNVPLAILGSTGERWTGFGQLNGTVSNTGSVALTYRHQFLVNVLADPPAGGAVGPDGGWFDANSVLQLSASPSQGWRFNSWSGIGSSQYTGKNSSVQLEVQGPTTEQAHFYASLSLTSDGGGSIAYAVGNRTGEVGAGKSILVYVPEGTPVTLKAAPSSFFMAFKGWGGGVASSSNPLSLSAVSPLAVTAVFGANTVNSLISVSLVVTLVGAFVAYILIRREIPFAGLLRSLRKRVRFPDR